MLVGNKKTHTQYNTTTHMSILLCEAEISFKREFMFCPGRRWRADFGLVEYPLLIEIEGGVWVKGRHVNPSGFIKDMEKYNTAACLGYHLIRVLPSQVKNGEAIEWVKKFIENCKNPLTCLLV